MSKKDDVIETSGIVAEALPNAQFKVTLENQHTILAHLSGKMRINFIRIFRGNKITFKLTFYNWKKEKKTYRKKKTEKKKKRKG